MELEQLIEEVKKDLANGDDIDKVVADYVSWGYCLPEQAEQLRGHFTPPDVPMDIPQPPPSFSPSPPERDVPVLQIDRTELQPNIALTPKFTIQGGSPQHPLLVHFPIDSRISHNDQKWEDVPTLKPSPEGWFFHQKLQLEKVGEYLFEITAVDLTPGFADPGYYHATFPMHVVDPKDVEQRRKVVIRADGNFVGNLDRFGKNADIEIIAGQNLTLNARDESIIDKLSPLSEPENAPDLTTTIQFQSDPDTARRVPYISQPDVPKQVSHLTMTESGKTKQFVLIGGQDLTFGRDVPEQGIQNDIPLLVLPGTPEEQERADEFAFLNGLFSREQAHFKVDSKGVYLAVGSGGIKDATILDRQPLTKGSETLVFPHDITDKQSRNILFSKMLAMKCTPYYERLREEALVKNSSVLLPEALLNKLYSLNYSDGLSSVCIMPEQYFQQKDYTGALLTILSQKVPQIAKSDWWKQWFSKKSNADPHHETHEYWFIPSFVTLGRDSRSAIRLENRHWHDVRLRILWIKNSLFVENISLDTDVKFGIGENCRSLVPFRPQPLCSGCVVQKGDAVLRFE